MVRPWVNGTLVVVPRRSDPSFGRQVFMGPECGLGAVRDAELLEDAGEVGFHRSFGDAQAPGDLLVRQALPDQR